MSEETPIQPPDGQEIVAENIGGTAVNESSNQVSVTEPIENPYPDRVEDPEKAHAMALAGDNERTYAAQKRDAARTIENYQLEHGKDEDSDTTWGLRAQLRVHPGFLGTPYSSSEVLIEGEGEGEGIEDEEKLRIRERLRRYAENNDENAEKLENWSAILHDHPVSEAYTNAHPEVEFNPERLTNLEGVVNKDLKTASWLEEESSKLKGLEVLNGVRGSREFGSGLFKVLANFEYDTYREHRLLDKWKQLESSEQTTLGEVSDFYKELLVEAEIKPLRNRANIIKALLEDIKSGRASEAASTGIAAETVNT